MIIFIPAWACSSRCRSCSRTRSGGLWIRCRIAAVRIGYRCPLHEIRNTKYRTATRYVYAGKVHVFTSSCSGRDRHADAEALRVVRQRTCSMCDAGLSSVYPYKRNTQAKSAWPKNLSSKASHRAASPSKARSRPPRRARQRRKWPSWPRRTTSARKT